MTQRSYNEWRNTAPSVKLFIFDSRISFFIALFMLHMRTYTFVILLIVISFAAVLEFQKINLANAAKRFRLMLSGRTKKR